MDLVLHCSSSRAVLSFFDVKKALDEMDGTEIMGKRVQVSKSTNVSYNTFYGF